jgi:hypothetical protein
MLPMDLRRITQQILQYNPTGNRDIERTRWRWEDDLETEQTVMTYLEVLCTPCMKWAL